MTANAAVANSLRLLLVVTLCSLLLEGSAFSQAYTLRAVDTVGGVGGVVTLPVELEVGIGQAGVGAFSFGVCHDSMFLTPIDAGMGSAFAGNAPDYFSPNVESDGVRCVSVLDFLGATVLGPGSYEVFVADYTTSAVPVQTAVTICDTVGVPPTESLVVVGTDGVVPQFDSGVVDTTASVNVGFELRLDPDTIGYEPATGAATFSIEPELEQTIGTTSAGIFGMTTVIQHDATYLTAVGAAPNPILQALNGGLGPDLFTFATEGANSVISFVTGSEFFTATLPRRPIAIEYQTNAAAVLNDGPLASPLVLTDANISGVDYSNELTVFASLLTEIPAVNSASINLVPGPVFPNVHYFGVPDFQGFEMTTSILGDVDQDLSGWSIAVCGDPAVLLPTAVELGSDTVGVNNGSSPSFVSTEIFPGGAWVHGAIVDLQSVVTLQAADNLEFLTATYDVVQDPFVGTQLSFCVAGSPPVSTLWIDAALDDVFPVLLTAEIDIPNLEVAFVRGDTNADGQAATLTDAINLLNFSFSGGASPPCLAAADSNGDGNVVGLIDSLFLLNYAFLGGSVPSAPFPDCGPDPMMSALGCDQGACP